MPKRIQLSRRKGFKLPAGTINVARPTRWGNPFPVARSPQDLAQPDKFCLTAKEAVERYRAVLFTDAFASDLRVALGSLRGHDLACWCQPGDPCHADVLLEVVNDPRAEPLTTIHRGEEVVIMGKCCTVERIPDTLGWGSFEFSHVTGSGGGAYHTNMGPVYPLALLDLCAGRPLAVASHPAA